MVYRYFLICHYGAPQLKLYTCLSGLSELQISGILMIIQRQFFLFLNGNLQFDPSLGPSRQDGLEPSRQDGSDEGSHCMFISSNKENYP